TAEDNRAGMLCQRVGQRIAEARPAGVERIAALLQHMADAAGCGIITMQDDQNGLGRCGHGCHCRSRCWASTPAAATPRGVTRSRNVTSLLPIPGTTRRRPAFSPR